MNQTQGAFGTRTCPTPRQPLDDEIDIEIRPVTIGDRELVRAFISGLSAQTQLQRFFSGVTPPTDRMLRALTTVDNRKDVLIAIRNGEIVGHAMGIRKGGAVEIGVVIADAWQTKGLGARLTRTLLRRAGAAGANEVSMDVMGENRRVLAIIRKHWPQARMTVDSGSIEVRAALG